MEQEGRRPFSEKDVAPVTDMDRVTGTGEKLLPLSSPTLEVPSLYPTVKSSQEPAVQGSAGLASRAHTGLCRWGVGWRLVQVEKASMPKDSDFYPKKGSRSDVTGIRELISPGCTFINHNFYSIMK